MTILVIDVFEGRRSRVAAALEVAESTAHVVSIARVREWHATSEPFAILIHGGSSSAQGAGNRVGGEDCFWELSKKPWRMPIVVYSGGRADPDGTEGVLLIAGGDNRTVWCQRRIEESLPTWDWNLRAWLAAVRAGGSRDELYAALHSIEPGLEDRLRFLYAASAALYGNVDLMDKAGAVANGMRYRSDVSAALNWVEQAKANFVAAEAALTNLRDAWLNGAGHDRSGTR